MKIKLLVNPGLVLSLLLLNNVVSAETLNEETSENKQMINVTQLSYIESEPGTGNYEVTILVSDRYIRIDEVGEDSGFIIYDDKDKSIYSVSHADRSTLVIKPHNFSAKQSPVKSYTEYKALTDAPEISGKNMFNYRVFVKKENDSANKNITGEETCTEIQLAAGLLPKVTNLLQNYQKVVSGQQVKMVDNKINEFQTPCYYADQVYNEGAYYEKGLPIQEWHSNERFKALKTFKRITVELDKFSVPEDYKEFSVDMESKRFLQ